YFEKRSGDVVASRSSAQRSAVNSSERRRTKMAASASGGERDRRPVGDGEGDDEENTLFVSWEQKGL
ncbi:hypothetical protein U1Q18_027622, partial [Sarracenia purpurea var. burkii]